MDFRITGACHAERIGVFDVRDEIGSMFIIPGGELLAAHPPRLVSAESQYVADAIAVEIGQEICQKEFVGNGGTRKVRQRFNPALVLYVRSDGKRIFRSRPARAIRDADKMRVQFFELVE